MTPSSHGARADGIPAPMIPDLPINDVIPALLETLLTRQRNAVLVAPPGAGKTTAVPLALLDADIGSKILLLEPRRLAARAAATRMSATLGEPVGTRIGFRTRLDSATGPATIVEVITEGLLTSRLLADPGLSGIGLVIFDEIHERALESDLAFALTRDLQRSLRPHDLRILAMSATAQAERLAAMLDADIITSAGRMFPVETTHTKRDIANLRDLPDEAAKAVRAALANHTGDILVFLPGMAEIRRTEAALAGCPALVLPLHGDLSPAAQDLALREHDRRRVVLATAIAETSLTVPGVRIVIDGGYRRSPRLDPGSGLTRLATLRISRAAATQRAGRAGREGPGVAIRLWSEALHRGFAPFDRPEIFEAELSGLALACAAWGEPPSSLPFPDAPPHGPLAAATALLTTLGALDESGKLTPLGREMSRLRAAPRLSAMMLAAPDKPARARAADLAAILEERDILGRDASADIALRLKALADKSGHNPIITRIAHAARLYRNRLNLPDIAGAGDPGALLACAFPDRIGQARGAPGEYRLSGGGSASLGPADSLGRARLIVAAAIDGKGGKIRLAAALNADALPDYLRARCRTTLESGFDAVSGGVITRERTRLGTLILSDRFIPTPPDEMQSALADALARRIDSLPWSPAATALCARVALLRTHDASLPDLCRAALATTAQTWLAPYLAGMTNIAQAQQLDLHAVLRATLTPAQAKRLDQALPTALHLPGGVVPIDYSGPIPLASARARTFYGLDSTPQLAGGKIPLQIALLSPAGRPIAITADLPGFWRGGWADARRDMRGRYPKHDWPEQPWR
ncbi:MAG: ATP-dependent helicase HrpB [Acidocella sp.]|nr:ATP-dependent helicase HrpB [Acidocella sp.]